MSFRWLSLTDVHFGASHVSAKSLYDKLKAVVYPQLKNINLLTIGGDFFDNAVYLCSEPATFGTMALHDMLELASQYGFAVRIIRGTFTHDRNQLSVTENIAKRYKNLDFQYYTDIAVDEIGGYTFLYLPDNLPYSCLEETMKVIHAKLESVDGMADFCVGHGYFRHAMPAVLGEDKLAECYRAESFKKIIRQKVIMGHVHTPSVYQDFVYYGGSFDRINHGEEEPKGFLMIEVDGNQSVVTFMPNPFAVPHLTINLEDSLSIEENCLVAKKFIDENILSNVDSYVRLIGNENRNTVKTLMCSEYPNITFTTLDSSARKKTNKNDKLNVQFRTFTGTVITSENVVHLLHKYLTDNISDFRLTEKDIQTGIDLLQSGGV